MELFIKKLTICSFTIYISNFIFPQAIYTSPKQYLIVGFFLTLTSYIIQVKVLKPETAWITNGVDMVAAALTIYFICKVISNTHMTFIESLLIAVLLGLIQITHHVWVKETEKVS